MGEPSYLSVNQDQDVIQIDNNMETLTMPKEQDRFSEGCENPRGCGQPKSKAFHRYGVLCQTNCKNYDDAKQ